MYIKGHTLRYSLVKLHNGFGPPCSPLTAKMVKLK